MSVIIKGMKLPQHAAVNGDKDTVYRCAILVHADNSVDLVVDAAFASAYDNGHNIQRYPITEIPTPHGRLIDAEELSKVFDWKQLENSPDEKGQTKKYYYIFRNRSWKNLYRYYAHKRNFWRTFRSKC